MNDIRVVFDFKGKEYKGILSPLSGAGTLGNYHLMVDNYYWGTLSYSQGSEGFNGGVHAFPAGWVFDSPSHPELNELADHFGYAVTAWVGSRK
ncbi:hypothetical protein [Segetibacter aerophilus]|nr:hypothetical protein [Segetibacter aerophilus]